MLQPESSTRDTGKSASQWSSTVTTDCENGHRKDAKRAHMLSVRKGFPNDSMLKLKTSEGLESSRLWIHLTGDLPQQKRDTRTHPPHWFCSSKAPHPQHLGENESIPTALYQTAGTWYSPWWHRSTRLDPLQEMMRSQRRVPDGSDNSSLERSPWQQCNEEMNGVERMGANRGVWKQARLERTYSEGLTKVRAGFHARKREAPQNSMATGYGT